MKKSHANPAHSQPLTSTPASGIAYTSDAQPPSAQFAAGPRLSRRRALALLLALPTALAACGGKAEPTPAPAASASPAATPQTTNRTVAGSRPHPTPPGRGVTASQTASSGAANAPALVPTPTPAGASLPDRLIIPDIELDISVVELGWSTNRAASNAIFSEWDVAAHAAGWHKNSALPGQAGNVVMSGHNNILGAVFRQLDQLRREDEITVYTSTTQYRYAVERVLIVPETQASASQRAENAQWIAPTPDERLTLVSCWPRNDNTHRIIVVARPRA